jgi:hypothetical protein
MLKLKGGNRYGYRRNERTELTIVNNKKNPETGRKNPTW